MSTNNRHGNKWTINEILSLQREYELLEWSVYEIAEKHERTVMAIMSKLQKECFIDSWNEARGFNIDEYQKDNFVLQTGTHYEDEDNNDDEEEDDDEEEYDYTEDVYDEDDDAEIEIENNVNQLTKRVWSLETSVGEISSIVKQLFNIFASNPKQESLEKM
jgi:DNA-directed RNA polymerase specialized sigma subunit